jgi:hypothetical protein
MSADVSSLLENVEDLVRRLSGEPDESMRGQGWTTESAAAICERLEKFALQLRNLNAMPPPAERPTNLVRALDHWGVQSGDLLEDLVEFEAKLRRFP